jgi:hypothetical protein
MTTGPTRPEITYEQYLMRRIAHPGLLGPCGGNAPHITGWPSPLQRLIPALNPYRELEARARQAEAQAGAEAEAG